MGSEKDNEIKVIFGRKISLTGITLLNIGSKKYGFPYTRLQKYVQHAISKENKVTYGACESIIWSTAYII